MTSAAASVLVCSPCPYCLAKVIQIRAPGTAPAWRVPILSFGEVLHDAWAVEHALEDCGGGVGLPGPRLGLSDDGRLLAVWPAARLGLNVTQPVGSTAVKVRYLHAISCEHWRGRDWAPGDRGQCAGCHLAIHWVVTPAGKKAPIDPRPRRGRLLSTAEARAMHGQPGLVIGLDSRGEQRSICEAESPLFGADGDPVVVWVNHFATCPERARFTR